MKRHSLLLWALLFIVPGMLCRSSVARADLLGYWSANSTGGTGTVLPNDQGNTDLNGELVGGAEYTAAGQGVTGQPGDYAVSFPGEDEDYATLPPTEATFEEITVTAWVKGVQNGDWAGIVLSRDGSQPIGIDFHAFDGELTYIWNNNSAQTWGFVSGLVIPEDDWTFTALTVTADAATLYVGPKGGQLESAVNEMAHFPQDNFTEWRLAEDNCCGTARNFSGLIDDVSIWDQALSEDQLAMLHSLSKTPLTLVGPVGVVGDFNDDGGLDAADIDLLSAEVRAGTNNPKFDLTSDGLVNDADRQDWVTNRRKTWFGDANLDGEFNSTDFVVVFQIGEYEDGVDFNSTWAEGDWNGDGNFSSGDFVTAFQDGGFERGPRAAAAVPEPSALALLLVGLLSAVWHRRGQ